MKQKQLFIVAAVALLVAFVVATLMFNLGKSGDNPALPAESRALLVRFHSPTLGPAEAKVEIVEFFDPACETCASFYPMVKKLIAQSPDKIRLVLRYAPFHQGSDAVVAMLEAARKQDKFWPALERLLTTQARWAPNHHPQVALAAAQLEGLGLNMEQLQRDMQSPEIAQRIQQDLDDARRLNVTMTPEFFVNARPLPTFGFEVLEGLVRDELAITGK